VLLLPINNTSAENLSALLGRRTSAAKTKPAHGYGLCGSCDFKKTSSAMAMRAKRP